MKVLHVAPLPSHGTPVLESPRPYFDGLDEETLTLVMRFLDSQPYGISASELADAIADELNRRQA